MKLQIAIILVETETPDNIGAAARSLKNMGLSDLRLVRPPLHWKEKGKKLAMSAFDILEKAKIYESLERAVEDCQVVVGTSRRLGGKRGTFLPFDKTLKRIHVNAVKSQCALVFGKESKGLDNASLGLCDFMTTIPSHQDYPSLNLAQAVMVCVFSIAQQAKSLPSVNKHTLKEPVRISKGSADDLLKRFRKALEVLDYSSEGADVIERILKTFRGLIQRNGLLESEAQMFKGLSRRIEDKLIKNKT